MDHAHDSQRFLKVPFWAASEISPETADSQWQDQALAHVFPPSTTALAAVEACAPLAPVDPGARDIRRRMADLTGRTLASSFVGTGARDVFGTLCRAYLKPGARVVVAQPSPMWMTAEVLATGAVYVDVGCDWNMSIRRDALERVLADQDIQMVVLADPNPITGVCLPESVRALATSHEALWVMDHTFSPWSDTPISGRGVSIRDLSLQAGVPSLPVATMVGEEDCIEGCWRVHPTCSVAAPARALARGLLGVTDAIDAHLAALSDRHIRLGEGLAKIAGIAVSEPGGPALMVHNMHEAASVLAQRLGDSISATWSSDHTWHGRLRLHAAASEAVNAAVETLSNIRASD